MPLLNRLLAVFRSRKLDQDLEEELRSHMEMRAEDNVAEGMTEEAARQDAVRRFGNSALIKEATRGERIILWLETLWQDLRYALRGMRKSPGFSAMAVLIVAVGIGSGATIFSITDTALRRSYYESVSDRWVMLRAFYPLRNLCVFTFSIPEYLEVRSQSQVFEKVAFVGGSGCTLMLDNAPEIFECTRVTADAIPMTHIDPLIGRTILPEEDTPGGPKVAVLSYELWQSRFRGDPHVLGTPIRLDGENYSVVGVMPPRYRLWGGEIWIPFQLHVSDTRSDDRRVELA
jgi:hypothetical protein